LTTSLDESTISIDHHHFSGSTIDLMYPARVGWRGLFAEAALQP
jgi:hypothetical protein